MIQIQTLSFIILILFYIQIQPVFNCFKVRVGSPTVTVSKQPGVTSSLGCYGCGPCNAFCCNCNKGCCNKRKRDINSFIKSNDTEYFNSLDLNHNSVIDYNEYVAFMKTLKSDLLKNSTALKSEFNKMDDNKDGKIQRREFSTDDISD